MSAEASSPLDRAAWPEALTARVVAPGERPAVHGYDVHDDLARHYRWTEVLALTLTGEAPDEALAPALDVAMTFLSACSVAEAPAHASVLAGVCGASSSATLGIAAIALAEQARASVARYLALRASLAPGGEARSHAPAGAGPGAQREPLASDAPHAAPEPAVARLEARLCERGVAEIALEKRAGIEEAALSVLEGCGLATARQLEAAWVLARLPAALAEAWSNEAGAFRTYPAGLPRFVYEPANGGAP